MRLNSVRRSGLLLPAGLVFTSSVAWAQAAPAPAPTEAPAAAPTAAPEAPPAAGEAGSTEAPAASADAATSTEPPAAEPSGAAPEAAEEAEAEAPAGISFLLFGDAYASVQTAQPGTAAPAHRAYDSTFRLPGGLENRNGFGLAFGGLDAGYSNDHLGATLSLRFGPGVTQFYAQEPVLGGIGAITQAFGTWKPTDKLSVDLGMFGTIFGAEVAESWFNMNYTRGALYYQMQPFWHTGARVAYQLTDSLAVKALLVNDANQLSIANGQNAQAAVQLVYTADALSVAAGTLQTLGDTSTLGFDRFVDLVVTYAPGDFKLVFNGDFNLNDAADTTFYGLSLAAGYKFAPAFGIAARGEFLDPNPDADDDHLVTGTLTMDVKPVPDSENVILRWDNRIESSGAQIFFDGGGGPTDAWFTSTIGMVVQTGGLF